MRSAPAWRSPSRRWPSSAPAAHSRSRAPEDLEVSLSIVEIGDQPLEPLRLLGLARLRRVGRRGRVRPARRRAAARTRRRRTPRGSGGPRDVVRHGSGRRAQGDRALRRRERQRESRAARHPRQACARAREAAHHARRPHARPRYGEVPAGSDRHRSQRPLRRRRARRASRRDSGHRARQLGERREPVPRAALDGATLNNDDRRARRARARGDLRASCSR